MASKNTASNIIDRVVADLQRMEQKAAKSKITNLGEEPPTRSQRAKSGIAPIAARQNIHRDAFDRLDRRLGRRNGRA